MRPEEGYEDAEIKGGVIRQHADGRLEIAIDHDKGRTVLKAVRRGFIFGDLSSARTLMDLVKDLQASEEV